MEHQLKTWSAQSKHCLLVQIVWGCTLSTCPQHYTSATKCTRIVLGNVRCNYLHKFLKNHGWVSSNYLIYGTKRVGNLPMRFMWIVYQYSAILSRRIPKSKHNGRATQMFDMHFGPYGFYTKNLVHRASYFVIYIFRLYTCPQVFAYYLFIHLLAHLISISLA